MSITSSVGLISGIDSQSLIQQLLQIEARPQQLAQRRIAQLQQQQAAYLQLNSALLALEGAAGAFNSRDVFDSSTASSSNPDVLSATASANAAEGTYDFLVDRLVSTQRSLSRGFVDRDVSGIGATSFTFERGSGSVRTETLLSNLNGGDGISRGQIRITDGSGATSTVDLSRVVTVDDVLDAINADSTISVRAEIDGDELRLVDTSGGGGNLTVADVFGYSTAESLGIAGSASGSISSGSLTQLSENTSLASLNDGLGVLVRDATNDFRIRIDTGGADPVVLNIDLGLQTTEVLSEEWTDPDGVTHAAGTEYASIAPDPLPEDFEKPETEDRVDQRRSTTIGDVIDAINNQANEAGIGVTASINAAGTGIDLNVTEPGALSVEVVEPTGSDGNALGSTARGLGLLTDGPVAPGVINGERLTSGLNTILTRNILGGAGLSTGAVDFTDRNGVTTSVNFDAALVGGSLTELIDGVNDALEAAGNGLRLEVNQVGNGLAVRDTSGGTGGFSISGDPAKELGIIAGGVQANTLDAGSLQRKWIGEATRLDSLNGGVGIGQGSFTIRDASGAESTITVDSNEITVNDLLSLINSRPDIDVLARINDNGDGIVIEDQTGVSGTLTIRDNNGTVADALNLAGSATTESGSGASPSIDGSYERTVTVSASDTLDDIRTAINLADVGATASIINDGNGATPFRLSFTSDRSGSAGRLLVSSTGVNLGLTEIERGQDAVVFFGSTDPARAVLLRSNDSTLDDVVPGVSIDLKATSETPVEVVVQRDLGAVETAVEEFVTAFNEVISLIGRLTDYDADTERRGALLGDATPRNIERQLLNTVQGRGRGVDGRYDFLFEIGVKVGTGGELEFDRERLRGALEEDYDSVRELLSAFKQEAPEPIVIAEGITVRNDEPSFSRLGVAEIIESLVEDLTNSFDGRLTRRSRLLDDQIALQEGRIDQFQARLDQKRSSLEAQFLAMEKALAQLQTQQQSIGSFGAF